MTIALGSNIISNGTAFDTKDVVLNCNGCIGIYIAKTKEEAIEYSTQRPDVLVIVVEDE